MIPKEQCEKMLDAEAERVARSILNLIGQVRFKRSQLDLDVSEEAIKGANIVAHIIKTELTKEITDKFITSTYTDDNST